MTVPPMAGVGAAAASGSMMKEGAGEIGSQLAGGGLRPIQILWNKLMSIWDHFSYIVVWIILIAGLIYGGLRFAPHIISQGAQAAHEQGIDDVGDVPEKAGEVYDETKGQVTGDVEKENAKVSGTYQESSVDQHSKENLGVFIKDLQLSEPEYKYDDPVSAWGTIEVSTISEDGTDLMVECLLNDPDDKDKEDVLGTITPSFEEPIKVYDEDMIDFKCDFPPGKLDEGVNKMITRSHFNFETTAYVKASFMDAESLRTVKRESPSLLSDIDTDPKAQNTEGPIRVGIGSREFPIPMGNDNGVLPSLTISITNNWNGKLRELESVEINLPEGAVLANCDSTKPVEKINTEDGRVFYRVRNSGIQHMNQNIENDDDDFVSQSIRCQMDFDKNKMLAGNSLLNPVEKTIFVNTKYSYEIEEEENLFVDENEGFIVSFQADSDPVKELTKGSEIRCRGRYYDGQIKTCRYTLSLLRDNEELQKTETEYATVQGPSEVSCYAPVFSLQNSEMNPFEQDIQRGDSILCEMEMETKYDGESINSSRFATIVNDVPEIDDIEFSSREIYERQSTRCVATVEDGDQDDITSNYEIMIDGEIKQQGEVSCSTDGEDKVCTVDIESEIIEGNTISCRMTANDGHAPSQKESVFEEIKESDSATSSTTQTCESTDGLDMYEKGTTEGLDENSQQITGEDTCLDLSENPSSTGNKIKEFFCNRDDIVDFNTYTCDCSDGACLR